jgi:hypothetical protein
MYKELNGSQPRIDKRISRFLSSWGANSKTWNVIGTEGIPTKDR